MSVITQCCACQKIRQGTHWVEQSEVVLSDEPVSHGYCPACAKDAYQAIEVDQSNGNLSFPKAFQSAKASSILHVGPKDK
jgi:hypothetical protein